MSDSDAYSYEYDEDDSAVGDDANEDFNYSQKKTTTKATTPPTPTSKKEKSPSKMATTMPRRVVTMAIWKRRARSLRMWLGWRLV